MTAFTESLATFYRGKRVLLTGHTGFKGAWLSLWLQKMGAVVHGVSLAPLGDETMHVGCGLHDGEPYLDIGNLSALRERFARFQPDLVFHLAAQALVGPSYDDPLGTFTTNVMGSLHVLQCIRETPSVRAAVMVSSDKCYENVEQIWGYRETDRLGGSDPYSASKGAAEVAIFGYLRSFFSAEGSANIGSVRAGNVVGGGDFSTLRLIPDCVRALRVGEPVRLRNPRSTRPWQFVLEPLGGYLLLGQRLAEHGKRFQGAWNFGPAVDNTTTVERGARAFFRAWGKGELIVEPSDAFRESVLLQVDCSKARVELGWRAVLDFDETMRQTALWYRENERAKATMREFSLAQLREFEGHLDRELSAH